MVMGVLKGAEEFGLLTADLTPCKQKLSAITQNWVSWWVERKSAQAGFGRQVVSDRRVGQHSNRTRMGVMVVQCSAPNMCHNNQQSVLTDLVSRLQSAIPNKMVSPQSVSVSSARDIPSQVTSYSPAVSLRTTRFNIQKFYMVFALLWVFCVDLRTDSDFCFIHH